MLGRKILVTGAAGFIGSHLALELLKEGNSVICIDNFNEYYDPLLKRQRKKRIDDYVTNNNVKSSRYFFAELDLLDFDSLSKLNELHQPQVICHLAAQAGVRYSIKYPHTYLDNNITATVNLLEISKEKKIHDFILASTSSVYGLSEDMPFTEDTPIDSTISTYSTTKRSCELLCHTYNNLFGINFRILRFFTVYGPWGRPDMALFKFTKAIYQGKPIEIYNYGDMCRDFTYVDDIVSGFTNSIEANHKFEIINLGCGNPIGLMDFIKTLEDVIGREAIKDMKDMQPGDVNKTWADISKARNLLNYKPKVQIREGISNFVKWYNKYYDIK